jgi:hypothetical protein
MSDNFSRVGKGLGLEPQTVQPVNGLDGEVYYDSVLQQFLGHRAGAWQTLGSGGFGVNFISNFDGESNAAGYALYNNGATSVPTTGTGGSVSGLTFTVTRTVGEVLYQNGSFKLSKDAANRQGEGVSYDFKVDQGYSGFSMMVKFIYKTTANFSYGAGTSASPSDISVFIYDIDGSKLVPLSTNYLDGSGSFLATFPTNATSVNYRIIFHNSTTNALSWDFIFDSLIAGPVEAVKGSVTTDFNSNLTFTPNNWGAIGTSNIFSRQVGDSIEVEGSFITGTGTSSAVSITLPFNIDFNKVKLNQTLGFFTGEASGASVPGSVFSDGTTSNQVFFALNNSGGSFVKSIGTDYTTGVTLSFKFKVAVSGLQSGMILSSETSTKEAIANISKTSSQSPGGSQLQISFDTVIKDSVVGWNAGSNSYTVQIAGDYVFNIMVSSTSATSTEATLFLKKNGITVYSTIENNSFNNSKLITPPITCSPQDVFTVFMTSTVVVPFASGFFSAQKLSQPQTVVFSGNKSAYLSNHQTSGSNHPGLNAGSYAALTLNTLQDPFGFIGNSANFTGTSGTNNLIVLPPGIYEIDGQLYRRDTNPANQTFRLRFQAIDNSVSILGSGAATLQGDTAQHTSAGFIKGVFSIGVSTTFQLQGRAVASAASNGISFAGEDEVFEQLIIRKLS